MCLSSKQKVSLNKVQHFTCLGSIRNLFHDEIIKSLYWISRLSKEPFCFLKENFKVMCKVNIILTYFILKTFYKFLRFFSTDGKRQSTVESRDNQLLTFTLRHVKSEATYNEPIQEWEMTSDMAVRDYSGTYVFNLIPCVVDENVRQFLIIIFQ